MKILYIDVDIYRDFKHELNVSYVHLHKETNDANSVPLFLSKTERHTQHCPPHRNPSSQDPPSEAPWEVCVDMRDFHGETQGPFLIKKTHPKYRELMNL